MKNILKSIGAEKVIDYTGENFIIPIGMYDLIFMAIDKLSFAACKNILNENGIYLNVNKPIKSLSMLLTTLITDKKVITGENSTVTSEDLDALKNLVVKGELKPVIDKS